MRALEEPKPKKKKDNSVQSHRSYWEPLILAQPEDRKKNNQLLHH